MFPVPPKLVYLLSGSTTCTLVDQEIFTSRRENVLSLPLRRLKLAGTVIKLVQSELEVV